MNGITAFVPPVFIGQVSADTEGGSSANTVDLYQRMYVNCGSWQLGSTDFAIVSKFSIALCFWIDPSKTDFKPEAEKLKKKQQLLEISSKDDPDLYGFLADERVGVSDYFTLCVHLEDSKLTSKLVIAVPDCHISMFKNWNMDGFCRESSKPNDGNINGYPLFPVSYEHLFVSFLSYARSKTDTANVIQVGDLRDSWHTQWMFELAFDIYRETLTTDISLFRDHCKKYEKAPASRWDHWKTVNTRARFPAELLANPAKWLNAVTKKDKSSTDSERPHYDWWRHFHKHVGVNDVEAALYEQPEKIISEVAKLWRAKITPYDVIAIIWWGCDLKWHTTPLSQSDFSAIEDLLTDLGDQDNWFWSLFKSPPTLSHPGYKAISKFKGMLKDGEHTLDFLDLAEVERRIDLQYTPDLQAALKQFNSSNYLRGNHDCLADNMYLHEKFKQGLDEETLAANWDFGCRAFKSVGAKGLQDAEVTLTHSDNKSKLSLLVGHQGSICIEHGDAWDRQNNDIGYFYFSVGHPWKDQYDFVSNAWSILGKFVTDGGYHSVKSSGYNLDQLQTATFNLRRVRHWFSKWIGDKGLEPPAEYRMMRIFCQGFETPGSKASKVRVVIMGHTHLPKIMLVSSHDAKKTRRPVSDEGVWII